MFSLYFIASKTAVVERTIKVWKSKYFNINLLCESNVFLVQ